MNTARRLHFSYVHTYTPPWPATNGLALVNRTGPSNRYVQTDMSGTVYSIHKIRGYLIRALITMDVETTPENRFRRVQSILCTHRMCCYVWADFAPWHVIQAHRRVEHKVFWSLLTAVVLSWVNKAKAILFSRHRVRYSKINGIRQWHELRCWI